MKNQNLNQYSQRQLRVGEMIKQSLGQIFLRGEAKLPELETNMITVTEVRMSPDLKNARAYIIPLGGKDADKTVRSLTEFSYLVRKALSKKIHMKFLPKISFVSDKSFDYAEKIEKIIKEINWYNMKNQTKNIIDTLAINNKDTGSSEVQIGLLTKKIEKLAEHFKKFKKDKHSSLGLLKAVNRRKKLLQYLKRNNIESYNNVLTKLNLRK